MHRIKHRLLLTLKHLVFAASAVMGYGLGQGGLRSGRFWSDALAIMGICYLTVGLFRLVRLSGFFDLAIFSTKKLWEIIRTRDYTVSKAKYVDFADYKKTNQYNKSCGELLITAIILFAASFVLMKI